MPTEKKEEQEREVKGAPSILEEDQTSFVDEDTRRGKQLTDRKVVDLEHVGASTPDTDPDQLSKQPDEDEREEP
jgi:hypothetical protein